MNAREYVKWTRREMLKLGLMAGGATLIGSRALRPTQAFGDSLYIETFPTSR